MKVGRGTLGTLAKVLCVGVALWGVDLLLGGYRLNQIVAVKQHIASTKQLIEDEKHAAIVMRAEAAELQERLAEARKDIRMLQQKFDAASVAAKAASENRAAGLPALARAEQHSSNRNELLPPAAAAVKGGGGATGGGERRSDEFQMNRVIESPPYCTETAKNRPPAPDRLAGKLPQFVFVAGVEGSGHHALKDVWWQLEASGVKVKLVVYDQLFHSFGIENHASFHYSSIRRSAHMKAMRPLFEQAAKDGAFVIDAQNSYPMGKGAGSLAHPDLLMMQELDGVLFDLKVIILYRDPANATLSAVRRFQDKEEYLFKNYQFQARMVSENLATLNNAIPMLPCSRTIAIRYEDLTQHPDLLSEPMAKLLGVDITVLKTAFGKLHPHQAKPDSPDKAAKRKMLNTFFDVQKTMWPLLASN
jgi:hypothetical protein